MAETQKTHARLMELRSASEEELASVVANAHKSIYLFYKDLLSKPQENTKVVRNNRKEIARILTILRERELVEERK